MPEYITNPLSVKYTLPEFNNTSQNYQKWLDIFNRLVNYFTSIASSTNRLSISGNCVARLSGTLYDFNINAIGIVDNGPLKRIQVWIVDSQYPYLYIDMFTVNQSLSTSFYNRNTSGPVNGSPNTLTIVSSEYYQIVTAEVTMELYQLNCESIRVDKSGYIVLIKTIYGNFKEITSITSPSIIIAYDEVINFNYVYIPQLSRYYFVEEVISVRKGLWQLRLKVDVLMTYKTTILQQKGYISRCAFEYNFDIVDNERIAENRTDVEIVVADETIFDSPMPLTDTIINYKED